MELRQIFNIIWKWLWLVVLAVVIASASSYFASKATTPLYQTKTTLMIGSFTQELNPNSSEMYTSQMLAYTYIQLIQREPVLRGAIESLGLNMNWQSLKGQISASTVPQTQLLEIYIVDSDPYRAKLLADAVAQQLILLSPGIQNNTGEIDQVEFSRQQINDLRQKIEESNKELERLRQELDAANSARQIQELNTQIALLESKISGWQNTYSQLLISLQGGSVNSISLIEEATIPTYPFSPNTRNNVLVAAAIGAVLAAAGALLIEYLDDTVKSPDDILRQTNLTTLGGIPQISGDEYSKKLISLHEPLSPIVEAFRILRTNLQFSALDRPLSSLMVTSPNPSEGKSIAISNLAVVIAQSGMKVILVDADLRRPTIHKIFDVPNRRGLTDAILHPDLAEQGQIALPAQGEKVPAGALEHSKQVSSLFSKLQTQPGPATEDNWVSEQKKPVTTRQHVDLSEYLQTTPVENLRILPTGALPPNPAELLASHRMINMISALKSHADIILFDSPPCLAVADAAILSTRVDGAMLVTDVGRTRTSEVRRAVEEMRRVKANLLGAVLNRLPRRGGYGGYRYYYYYYYRDGEKHSRKATLAQRVFPWFSRNGKSARPIEKS